MEKIIHQIWIGPYEMPEREKRFVSKVKEKNKSYKHILWTNDNLPEFPDNLKELYATFEKAEDYVHQADILRIFLIAEYGGIYMDVDFDCVGSIDNTDISNSNGFFCYHGGDDYTMPNGVFGVAKSSEMAKFLFSKVQPENQWYGPSWLGDTVKEFLGYERETSHELVKSELAKIGIKYLTFNLWESRFFKHHALYSWSPENKANFKNGNINYLW